MTEILKLILKISFVCLQILNNPVYSQTNLALKKPAYLSSTFASFFASYAVDGDKTTDRQFAHTDGNDPGWLVVDLGKDYKVQYVILYNRIDCCGDREDKFSVGFSNNFNPSINLTIVKNILCGKYGTTTGNGEIIRLNCSQPYIKSRFVMLQQSEGKNSLNVQEFEVYGSEIYLNQYIGCCSQVQQLLPSRIVPSLEQCFQYCSTFNTNYIAMLNGSTCHCTNNIQLCSTSEKCNITSINNDSMCGGQYYFSVYSVSDCSSGTQFGFCLSSPGSSSGCKSGWEGENCNQRKCSTNNGDCGNHTCVTNNFGVNIITECQCKNGYTKRHFNDKCTDINECEQQLSKCDNSTTSCANKEGSYECICKEGFEKRDNDFECQDINECQLGTHKCDSNSTACNNTEGSYECNCITDFERKDSYECTRFPIKPNSLSAGAVIGGVIGAIIFAAVIVGIVLLLKRKINVYKNATKIYEAPPTPSTQIGIATLKEYYLENADILAHEFKSIPMKSDDNCSYALQSALKKKNRFKNVVPFDINRIQLEVFDDDFLSDYINASYVPSHFTEKYNFIAAQGPKEETLNDFWRMICEQKVLLIVMLTTCFENATKKCAQYWSDDARQTYGEVTVEVEIVDVWPGHEIRYLTVEKNKQSFKVVHMMYKQWFDHKVPENVGDLLNFHYRMMQFIESLNVPTVLVHCSAGAGRTGAFVAIDNLINQVEKEGYVDVFSCLKELRSHRNYMIQTQDQYHLCYKALILYNLIGNSTFYNISNESWSKFRKIPNYEMEIAKQFESFQDPVFKQQKNGGKTNESEPPTTPFEIPVFGTKSYFQIFVTTSARFNDCLSQVFKENTSMVVLLESLFENKHSSTFLTSDKNEIKLNNLTIQIERRTEKKYGQSASVHQHFNKSDAIYENSDLSQQKTTFLIVNQNCSAEVIFELYQEFASLIGRTNIAVMCSEYNNSGYLVAALNLIEMMEKYKEVDVYQAVHEVKKMHPKFISNVELFEELYDFVEDYMQFRTKKNLNLSSEVDHIYFNE